jgi:hypothetical protein
MIRQIDYNTALGIIRDEYDGDRFDVREFTFEDGLKGYIFSDTKFKNSHWRVLFTGDEYNPRIINAGTHHLAYFPDSIEIEAVKPIAEMKVTWVKA